MTRTMRTTRTALVTATLAGTLWGLSQGLLAAAQPSASGTTVTSTMQIELGNERFPFQYRSSKISINLAQFYIVSGSQTEPVPSIVGATTLASAAVSVAAAPRAPLDLPPATLASLREAFCSG